MMSAVFGLFFALAMLSQITDAAPIAIPIGKDGEIKALLPDGSVLQLLLGANALHLVVYLGKSIISMLKKDKDKLENRVEDLTKAVNEMRGELHGIRILPDEKEIMRRLEEKMEFMVFKVVKHMDFKKNASRD